MDQADGANDAAWAPPSAGGAGTRPLVAGYSDFVLIARGGDSVVYRAHQDAIDRDVAIKVVQLDDAESIARFGRELALTVRLGRQHPHIMTVLDTGTTSGGQPCLVMDYVELGSLHDRLNERGPLPVSEVVAAGSVIADALAFAHAQGVLHRDVKPQNVLVLPTSYVLADFGLARAIDAGHSSSLERFSYRHASPQILDGEPPTVADDVWSLGSTLFTLLDGRAPFAADDPDEDSALSYLRRARTEPPRVLDRDDLPPQVIEIVGRCLSRERGDRFADAAALRDALDAVPTETRKWAPDTAPVVEPAPVDAPEEPVDPDAGFAPPPIVPEPVAPPPVVPRPEPVLAASALVAIDPPPRAAPLVDELPEPPAVSALAQLPAGQPHTVRDADATGLRPNEPPNAAPARHAADPGGTRRRWILIAVAGILALAVGTAIGLVRGSSGSPAAHRGTTGQSTPLATGPATSTSGTTTTVPTANATGALRQGSQPRILSYLRSAANSVRLSWQDPSKGQYPFVVVEIVDAKPHPENVSLPPGTTSATIPDVPPGYHCFGVGIVSPGGVGITLGPTLCKTT